MRDARLQCWAEIGASQGVCSALHDVPFKNGSTQFSRRSDPDCLPGKAPRLLLYLCSGPLDAHAGTDRAARAPDKVTFANEDEAWQRRAEELILNICDEL